MAKHPVVLHTRRFLEWELRGRGWFSYPYPVELEPPFLPFPGHDRSPVNQMDDGRRETWLSRLFSPQEDPPSEGEVEDDTEPLPAPFSWPQPVTELRLYFEEALPPVTETWLSMLGRFEYPLAFELLGHDGEVSYRLAGEEGEVHHAAGALAQLAPDASVEEAPPLAMAWGTTGRLYLIAELALAKEFMIPLEAGPGALQGLAAALASVESGLALVQLLVAPVRAPWADSVVRSVQTGSGEPFFADAPEITNAAKKKCSSSLRAVSVRLGLSADSQGQLTHLVKSVGGALEAYGAPQGNLLVPVMAEDEVDLQEDLLTRTTHRPGMILSVSELLPLVGFEYLPEGVPGLGPTEVLELPEAVQGQGVLLAHAEDGREARLSLPDRLRHLHVVGATGTGKSNLLLSLILQDIEEGRGVVLLDPHGELVEDVIARVPPEALERTVLLDPTDAESAVGWNMLEPGSDEEAERLAGDLVGTFKRLASSWGDQMTAVLTNAILAILDAGGGTLLDLRTFLVERSYRDKVLSRVTDPYRKSFWQSEFPQLSGGKSIGPILTRLDTFLRFRTLRRLVASRGRSIDFEHILDDGILLAPLSVGTFGRENAALLGSLLVGALSGAAFRRTSRTPAFIYLDECHEVATVSLAHLITGVRKFGVGLVLAHQDLHQLRSAASDVERSVLANAHSRMVFRVGEEDTRRLAGGFAHFEPTDLLSLRVGEAVARVGGASEDFKAKTVLVEDVAVEKRQEQKARLQELMRERFPLVEELPPDRPVPSPVAPPPTRKSSEARKETSPPREKRKPIEPPTPGRGGAEHQYLQALVKRLGESKGFRATLEAPAGGGQVDVALEREDKRIAVEIAVTTGPEHELRNIQKCLPEFDEVLVVAGGSRVRKRLQNMLEELSEEERERVEVLSPEEASSYLLSLPEAGGKKIKGYVVRRRYQEAEGAGAKARQETVARIIAERLRKMGGGGE